MTKRLKNIIGILICWVVFVFLALWVFGIWPKTIIGWILAFFVGPVVLLIIEGIGEGIYELYKRIPFISHARKSIKTRTKNERTSLERMGYLFFECTLFITVILFIFYFLDKHLGSVFDPIFEFFKKHYKY